MSTEPQTATALDLEPREVEATLQPLERATMLPPRAFVDPGVFEWELETIFRGWICVGHASRVAEPGSYLMREIGSDSVVVMGGGGRPPARLPQRLPASRRAVDRGGRGQRAAPDPVPLPRLVLRARRRAQGDAPHGRGRGLRHLVLGPDPGAGRDRRGPGPGRPRAARRPTSRPTSASSAGHLERYRVEALRRAGQASLRGRGQLEGDRRELQRVPALPRRPPGAQRGSATT